MRYILRSETGFSMVQAMGAALIVGGLGLVVSQMMRDSSMAMRRSFQQNARLNIASYYAAITRDPQNRAVTATQTANGALIGHAAGTAAFPAVNPATIDLRNVDTVTGLPVGMRPLEFFRPSATGPVVEIPAGGLHLRDGGERCLDSGLPAGSCPPDKATFRVRSAWIPLASGKYEVEVLVDQVNLGENDMQMKTITSASLDVHGFWQAAAAGAINNVNAGNVGINTTNPTTTLTVNGTITSAGPVISTTAVTNASQGDTLTTKTYVDNNTIAFANRGLCAGGQVMVGFDGSGNRVCINPTDPRIGTLTEGKWCKVTGGVINCTTDGPQLECNTQYCAPATGVPCVGNCPAGYTMTACNGSGPCQSIAGSDGTGTSLSWTCCRVN